VECCKYINIADDDCGCNDDNDDGNDDEWVVIQYGSGGSSVHGDNGV